MLKLSEDREFAAITKQLDDYATRVKLRQIQRGKLSHRYGAEYQPNLPYPYGDREAHQFRERIRAFVSQPKHSEEDKQQINGSLLWTYRNYLGTPFEQHALVLIDVTLKEFPLKDSEKVNFFNYILSPSQLDKEPLYTKFSPEQMCRLADFNPNGEYEARQSQVIFSRIEMLMEKKLRSPEKNEARVLRLQPFLNSYASKIGRSDYDLLARYTKLWLKMADSVPEQIVNANMFGHLLTKTAALRERQARNGTLFDDMSPLEVPKIDYLGLKKLSQSYVSHMFEYNKSSGKLHHGLYAGMTDFLAKVSTYYPLQQAETKKITDVFERVSENNDIGKYLKGQGKEFLTNCRRCWPRKTKPSQAQGKTFIPKVASERY